MQKTLQYIAFVLIGLGILALIGWSVQAFFMADDIPLWIRIGAGAIGLGIIILIAIAIKDRLTKDKNEDFKEVDK